MISGFTPEWPVPGHVKSWVTTRSGGVSQPPYDQLNLGTHVGDVVERVDKNRAQLEQQLSLPQQPQWLEQVHSCEVATLPAPATHQTIPIADGSWTDQSGVVCGVLTADCLPVLLSNQQGSAVAALHAGWRGLADGILQRGGARFMEPADQLLAWIGPGIGQSSYEVGGEVRETFCSRYPGAERNFIPSQSGRWLASMEGLARDQLQQLKLNGVHGGGRDTYAEEDFFSYRRSGVTGRFATLIWIEAEQKGTQ